MHFCSITKAFIKKDIDYDWDGLGHFPDFLISLHDLLDSPLQTNNVIKSAIAKISRQKQQYIFHPTTRLCKGFQLTAGNLALYFLFFDGIVIICSL